METQRRLKQIKPYLFKEEGKEEPKQESDEYDSEDEDSVILEI